MGAFKPVTTKENLAEMPDDEKITVTFTRDEFEYLMDFIETYRSDPQAVIDRERRKKPKKQRESVIRWGMDHLLSINIIRERMIHAIPLSSE